MMDRGEPDLWLAVTADATGSALGLVVVTGPVWEPNLLPLATQEVSVDTLVLPDDVGWMLLAWPQTNTEGADLYQTWVSVKTVAYGDYSMARPAAMIDNANCGWGSEIFRAGFERGNDSAW